MCRVLSIRSQSSIFTRGLTNILISSVETAIGQDVSKPSTPTTPHQERRLGRQIGTGHHDKIGLGLGHRHDAIGLDIDHRLDVIIADTQCFMVRMCGEEDSKTFPIVGFYGRPYHKHVQQPALNLCRMLVALKAEAANKWDDESFIIPPISDGRSKKYYRLALLSHPCFLSAV